MAKKFLTGLLITIGLLGLAGRPASGEEAARWSAVNIPAEGKAGGWVLAAGSDVKYLSRGADGELYCYARPSATSCTLFKSTDGGYSWSSIGGVTDSIIGIATAPNKANAVAYATASRVYRSTDAGNSFVLLPVGPGGAGGGSVEITSLAICQCGSSSIVAVGTRDVDGGQYGGVYIFDEGRSLTWVDTGIGGYDVYAVSFSPDYDIDAQLIAVVTDEVNTLVSSRIGDGGWGQMIGDACLNRDNSATPAPVAVDTSASIAFPAGYSAVKEGSFLFVGIDAGADGGDVYRITSRPAPLGSLARDLDIGSAYGVINLDVTGLVVVGEGSNPGLMAGTATGAQVYSSRDGGNTWARSARPPTGQGSTYVAMTPRGEAFAATSGTESAVSYSADGGQTWNQVGLIDDAVSTILGVAVSPEYERDSTLLLLTADVKHSLWRSRSGGARWERVLNSTLPEVDSITGVSFAPDAPRIVFVLGISNGRPVLWNSTDCGQTLTPRLICDPGSGAPLNVDTWTVVSEKTLFIASYDGSRGLVYRSDNGGLFYLPGAQAGTNPLYSIAISPDFHKDRAILVGSSLGRVFWSSDGGLTFEQLPPNAVTAPLGGNVAVALDPGFASNRTVYAASDTADKGIYRFIVGKSRAWESIDGTLAAGSRFNQVALSADGVLYVANSKTGGGMERCLNPTYSLGPTFETVSGGLDSNTVLSGLWPGENRLWSVDLANIWLVTLRDSLSVPPVLVSPADKAAGIELKGVSLDWQTLAGATKYKWQVDDDNSFQVLAAGFEDETAASSARLPVLENGTTYYWRVRVTEPVLSPWSVRHSFTTTLGSGATAPKLNCPEAGARNTPLRPVFQWDSVAGAASYELLISDDFSFANPVVARSGAYALPVNAWECNITLAHGTTYYWKVRAFGNDTSSAWSPVGVFTTEPAPQPPSPTPSAPLTKVEPAPTAGPPPVSQSPPSNPSPLTPAPAQATPEWSKWLVPIGAALFGVLLAILVTLVVLAVRIRRL